MLVRAPLPSVESGKLYAPDALALEVTNFQDTPDGTIRAVRGPCPYVPDYDLDQVFSLLFGKMHGIFHASLDGGMRDVLLVRTGSKLIEARGWEQDYVELKDDLSDEGNPRFPDQMCEVGGRIIWTNGVDRALAYDGYKLLPLGYDRAPSAPVAMGPAAAGSSTNANSEENPTVYRNSDAYAHPGRIGTPGDMFSGQNGNVRQGAWFYWVQFEDAFGNLSPLSPVSGPVTIRPENSATTYNKDFWALWNKDGQLGPYSVNIDDLTKQFLVHGISVGPEGTVARHLFRSRDTYVNASEPALVARIGDNYTEEYPDNHSDAELGGPALDVIPMPVFKIMCPYNGGLAIGNTSANPGILMLTDPLFPGTVRKGRWVYPDPNGAELSGVVNFEGKLLAFTASTVFEIIDDGVKIGRRPLTNNIGCVAPSSLKTTSWGALVWRGRDGFYAMQNGQITSVTDDQNIPLMQSLNSIMAAQSVAEWCPATREYLCAVAPGGSVDNELILAYNGRGWKRRVYHIKVGGMTLTRDDRGYVIICGEAAGAYNPPPYEPPPEDPPDSQPVDPQNPPDPDPTPNPQPGGTDASGTNVFVLDREVRSWTPPLKTYRWRSGWLRGDPTGRDRFNITTIYVGLVESSWAKLSWRVFRNMRFEAKFSSTDDTALRMMAPVGDDEVAIVLENLIIGTSIVRTPRLFWKKFDVKLTGVDSFSFELSCEEIDGAYPNIAGFAFDIKLNDGTGSSVSRG